MKGDYFENLFTGILCMWFSQSADRAFQSKVILNVPRTYFWRFQTAVRNYVKHKKKNVKHKLGKVPQSTLKQESPEMYQF
jgi:hypothetical protein